MNRIRPKFSEEETRLILEMWENGRIATLDLPVEVLYIEEIVLDRLLHNNILYLRDLTSVTKEYVIRNIRGLGIMRCNQIGKAAHDYGISFRRLKTYRMV